MVGRRAWWSGLIGMAARGTSHATTCPNVDFDSFYNVELKLS